MGIFTSLTRLLKHLDGLIEFMVRLLIVSIIVPELASIHDFSGKPMEYVLVVVVLLYWSFKEFLMFINIYTQEADAKI